MLVLEREVAADKIFGRRQWWRAGRATFLVSFSRDEQRCGIFISGTPETPRAEALFADLALSRETDITLEPSIDCYAIGCPSDYSQVMIERLAAAVS
jgi:hypothetical protein